MTTYRKATVNGTEYRFAKLRIRVANADGRLRLHVYARSRLSDGAIDKAENGALAIFNAKQLVIVAGGNSYVAKMFASKDMQYTGRAIVVDSEWVYESSTALVGAQA